MRRVVLRRIGRLIVRRPGAIAVILLLLTAASVWRVSALEINHNQLDLIPRDLPSVRATREMIDIRGGVGFLLILLRSDDLDHMKRVADDLSERLNAMEEIRYVRVTQDVAFVQERIGLYIETPDLKEAYKRIRKKIKSVLRKANPFFVELRKTKEVELDLSDLIDKYRAMNKKVIDDPYYVDIKKEVLLLVVKPAGEATDLEFTDKLMKGVEAQIADYNANNTRNAKLQESYKGTADGATVTYGYTGTYKRNLDDSETISAALVPTSGVAFVGILVYLLFFLRRPSQITLIMATLVASVIMSFAFCELVIGELNTVTAILGAILMGIGIDFGIHFIYRLREEYTLTGDLVASIETTIEHSGSASLTSALTTGSALFILA
ncbi:MAG: MMPL family transporter, partial [Myxococcota bacterium]